MRRLLLVTALIQSAPTFAAGTITYTYDVRGQLVQILRTGTVNNGVSKVYAIDRADNRTHMTTTGSINPPP